MPVQRRWQGSQTHSMDVRVPRKLLPRLPRRAGSLMPGFHSFYWLGLAATTWPKFAWTDGTLGPNSTTYGHWGYYMPQNIIEPNNLFPPELCAGANASQTYDQAWGWSDTGCSVVAPFVCRRLGGFPGLGGPAMQHKYRSTHERSCVRLCRNSGC